MLYSVVSIGSLAGALATARVARIAVRHVVLAAAAFGVAMLLLAFVPSLAASVPGSACSSAASSIALHDERRRPSSRSRADPAMRGRVLALQAMVFLGSTPIGGPLLGAICDAFGARSGILVGGLAALAAAAWGYAVCRARAGHAATGGFDRVSRGAAGRRPVRTRALNPVQDALISGPAERREAE